MKENVYLKARKTAAKWNPALNSRQAAADQLGVSSFTLADYELGNTKVVPVDKVVLMADLYNCPELMTGYCKNECPIGKSMAVATTVGGIEGVTLRILKELDPESIKGIRKSLVDIASDGVISEDEKPTLQSIVRRLDEMTIAISELRLASEKIIRGQGNEQN